MTIRPHEQADHSGSRRALGITISLIALAFCTYAVVDGQASGWIIALPLIALILTLLDR